MKDAIKWIAIGLGAYWLYETFFVTPAATTTTTPATTTTGTTTTGTTTSTTTPDFNSLAAIYSRMVAAAPSNALTADQWNVYLADQSSVIPPDPNSIWSFTDANPRTATMTAAQYWSKMEPYLVTQGMSGLGLYRGMGKFYRRRRIA
jgi:hypothetical protein